MTRHRRDGSDTTGVRESDEWRACSNIWPTSQRGSFLLTRRSDPKRMRATLQVVKEEMARRRHDPVDEQGQWLGSVVRGYLAYFAVPTNSRSIGRFRTEVIRMWCRNLRHRSHRFT